MTGYVVRTDGTVQAAPDKLSLHEMYAAIGARTVERVQGPWGEMWADEEGLLIGKPINRIATLLFNETYPHFPQRIVGDVYLRLKKGWLVTETQGVVRAPKR